VVHVLKFRSRQIEAIEADRMDAGAGSVFLRGLVRSYASFLKLDPKPLLCTLDEQAPVRQPEIRVPENMGAAMPKEGMQQMPLLIAAVVLLIAGVRIGWHYFGTLTQTIGDSTQVAAVEPVVAPMIQPERILPAAQAEMPVAAPPPESEQSVVSSAAAKVKLPIAAAPAQAVPAATPAVLPLVEGRRLSFQFQGESWVEVKDARDTVVLSGIVQDGTTRSVGGRAPFEIVIGNASVVTLKDDGKPVDLKPYTRAEVARLILK
jgi:cytoskeleton protein RodZ